METTIETELMNAQTDSGVQLLEPRAITEAGRTHLDEMIQHSRDEIRRIEVLLDNGAINHPNHDALVEDLQKYQDFIRDASTAITEPDERYFRAGVYGIFPDRVELIYTEGDHNRVTRITRDFWHFLGSPRVVLILK